MKIGTKEIRGMFHITGRGTIAELEKYDRDIKMNGVVALYNENKEFITETLITEIKTQGDTKMALRLRVDFEKVKNAKFYTA